MKMSTTKNRLFSVGQVFRVPKSIEILTISDGIIMNTDERPGIEIKRKLIERK